MRKTKITPLSALLFLLIFPSAALSCNEAVSLYNQAVSAEQDGKENLYRLALEAHCDDPCIVAKIHNNLGDTYEKKDLLDEALIQYLKAIEVCPSLVTPYFGVGDIYSRMGHMEDARKYHNKGFVLKSYKSRENIIAALDPETRLRAIEVVPKARPEQPPTIPEINFYFGFDQARIGSEGKRQLREMLLALNDQALSPYRFRIAGHTCSLGKGTYNQELSERRANAVRDWLVQSGVSTERLVPVGYGETRPIANNGTETIRRLNRRVEMRTVGSVVPMKRNADAEILKAHELLKEGEKYLILEQYDKAVSELEKALNVFRAGRNEAGIKAALRRISLNVVGSHNILRLNGVFGK